MITFAGVGVDSGHISHSFKPRYWKSKRPITKKGIDKTPILCYNKGTKEEEENNNAHTEIQ